MTKLIEIKPRGPRAVQANMGFSKTKGTMRGMHLQLASAVERSWSLKEFFTLR